MVNRVLILLEQSTLAIREIDVERNELGEAIAEHALQTIVARVGNDRGPHSVGERAISLLCLVRRGDPEDHGEREIAQGARFACGLPCNTGDRGWIEHAIGIDSDVGKPVGCREFCECVDEEAVMRPCTANQASIAL